MNHEEEDEAYEKYKREQGDEVDMFNSDEEDESDTESGDDDDDDDGESDESMSENMDSQDGETTNEGGASNEPEEVLIKLPDQEYQTKLAELEAQIEQNKYQYQCYVDLIKLTRNQSDVVKLALYRQQMSQLYPLTETLWLEWIKDETKNPGENKEEKHKRMVELFERAVEDYMSVDIWLEYIQYSLSRIQEPNGHQEIRAVCERAIRFAGLHVTKGSLLWQSYLMFEQILLSTLMTGNASNDKEKEQTDRIVRLYKLQLSVCLDTIDDTLEELKTLIDSAAEAPDVKSLYERTVKKYKEITPFEDALVKEEDPAKRLEAYNKYLDYELKLVRDLFEQMKGKASSEKSDMEEFDYQRRRLKCLFERAIADNSNCLDTDLWLKYTLYLNEEELFDNSDESKQFNLSVYKRAIRNIPWSSKLWINYLLELEKQNQTEEFVKGVYYEAMNSGFGASDDYLQLWHVYLDYLCRRFVSTSQQSETDRETRIEEIRDTFQKAINQIFDYFRVNGDPTFSLEKSWSLVEARHFNSMDRARRMYNEMILAKSEIGKITSTIWLDFYDLEKQFGDEKHQRKLLNRALNELDDDEEKLVVYEQLIKFERLNGNIHQFSAIYAKYEQFKHTREIKRQNEASQKKLAYQKKIENKENGKKEKKAPLLAPPKEPVKQQSLKRKNESNDERKPAEKRDKDGFLIPNLPPASPTTETTTKKAKDEQVFKQPEIPTSMLGLGGDKKYNESTVFISNLDYNVKEQSIIDIFSKVPGFKQVRLIKHWKGNTKGYGYVDFETKSQAEQAIKLDRVPVDGRPMFVSKNEDRSMDLGVNKFKYPTSLEKNKLFVSNLPFDLDSCGVEKLFKSFGTVKEVRLVTYRNGKSKGTAYVEFQDEASASKALVQTDNMLVGDRPISVAISNPPKRKQTDSEIKKVELKSSLGSGSIVSRNSTSSTAANSSSMFMPRSQVINRKKALNL